VQRSFAEEFDGPALNHSRWTVYDSNHDGQCGFGIGRYGRCDAANVYVEKGALVLRSDRNHSCAPGEGCFNYSSGGVTSRDKATWSVADGAGFRLCVSAVLPDGGAGIWPAHWMMPNDNNAQQGTPHCRGPGKNGGCSCDPDEGEIDILESESSNGLPPTIAPRGRLTQTAAVAADSGERQRPGLRHLPLADNLARAQLQLPAGPRVRPQVQSAAERLGQDSPRVRR